MLGSLLEKIQSKHLDKMYSSITSRYKKSKLYHLSEEELAKLQNFDRLMERIQPIITRPQVESASITYYLFRSTPKNYVSRRLHMRKEQSQHLYPQDFLHRSFQSEISEKYRQYLVDWLAELHYKFEMWPETLYVTVGIIDKTLMKW